MAHRVLIILFTILCTILLQAIFNYFCSSDYFEETINVRNFGLDSLWANIGGYVGMLLGISCLQLPDLVSHLIQYLPKKKSPLHQTTQMGQDTSEITIICN